MKFVDEAVITVESGRGGPGKVSFRRDKLVARGGPDGGDGGRGGSVIFKATSHLNSLLGLKYKKVFRASDGEPGGASRHTGPDGQDVILEFPIGTIIREKNSDDTLELTVHGKEYVYLKGGRGGKGNNFFKNSINQAPMFAQPGEPGEKREIKIELKLLADVGIIGFPNAGKSTLISKISAARPKVADYPFTTLVPNLGVVDSGDYTTFVVADIPGLIPGAHAGAGLGVKFLKHIEKTKCFLHLIDVSQFNEYKPMESFELINHELKAYDDTKQSEEPLATRPQIVALNKCDIVDADELQGIKRSFEKKGYKVFMISGLSGYGLKDVVFALKKLIDKQALQAAEG
ncbi:MAG: GTPase ObgE [Bdellovibrionota bacterium]